MTPQITVDPVIINLIDDDDDVVDNKDIIVVDDIDEKSAPQSGIDTCSSSVKPIRRSIRLRKKNSSAELNKLIAEEEEPFIFEQNESIDNKRPTNDAELIDAEKLVSYASQGYKIERGQFLVKLCIGPDEFVLAEAVDYLESLDYGKVAEDEQSNYSDDSLSYLIKEEFFEDPCGTSVEDRVKKNNAERERRKALRTYFSYVQNCINIVRPGLENQKWSKHKILSDAIEILNELKKTSIHQEWAITKLTSRNLKLVEKKLQISEKMKQCKKSETRKILSK